MSSETYLAKTVEEDLRQFNLGLASGLPASESTKHNNLADTHRNSNVTDKLRFMMAALKQQQYNIGYKI